MNSFLANFYYQTIPPDYYDLPNDKDEYDNKTPGTSVGNVFTDNEGVEYSVVTNEPRADANYEGICDDTLIDDADTSTLTIESVQEEITESEGEHPQNEGVDADNEGVDNGGRSTVAAYALPTDING